MADDKNTSTIFKKFFMGFFYASRGITSSLKERNIKFHVFAFFVVIVCAIFFKISKIEWFIVLILISLVFASEMINTSIEELANISKDKLGLSYSETTRARDVSAGAVLIIAIVSAIIGLVIFIPKIF